MTRNIRHAGIFSLLLLVALVVNAARVQLVRAPEYDANPANRRPDIARYQQPRGDILVGGEPVTGSRDTGEHLRFERTYQDGPMYAPVTGFASQEYGTTLLEHVEDGVLSGSDPMLAPLPLWNDVTRARNPGGDVVTTIDPAAQRAAYEGLGRRKGAVAAIEPSTGRVLALVSTPSYDPGSCPGTARRPAGPGSGSTRTRTSRCSTGRCGGRTRRGRRSRWSPRPRRWTRGSCGTWTPVPTPPTRTRCRAAAPG